MPEKRFDEDWFIAYRHHLLSCSSFAQESRRPQTVHNIIHNARLGGGVDERIEGELRRLPPRHASAVRAHMQFYRACLTATGLVPADTLVSAAVQIEWFWYATAFQTFYRDHLAHVMKVAAMGISLFQDKDGPLAVGGRALVDDVAERLADFRMGGPALRAAARRSGITEPTLHDPSFWRAAVLETTRLAGLLHDMAHPAMIASRISRIAAPVRPLSPFEPTEEELCRHTVASFGHRLLAAPWNRGELPDSRGLAREDAEVCAEVFLHAHGLRAGYAIVRLADDADRVWQLSPFDAFVTEWAALAVSLHDLDSLHTLSVARGSGLERIARWIAVPENREAIRPSFTRDPVTYMLALADWMQEFGRVLDPTSTDHERYGAQPAPGVRYPCRAVTLSLEGESGSDARVLLEMGPDDGTCFGATEWEYRSIRDHKEAEVKKNFTEGGWMDSRGLFSSLTFEAHRAAAERPAERATSTTRARVVKVFYSFAPEDEPSRAALERHLALLKHQGYLDDWHQRRVRAGGDWREEVDAHLDDADIVLLLLSADFFASDYLSGVELERALARHARGEARVVPILVRAVDLDPGPLAGMARLPRSGEPVSARADADEAWAEITREIRRMVEEIRSR